MPEDMEPSRLAPSGHPRPARLEDGVHEASDLAVLPASFGVVVAIGLANVLEMSMSLKTLHDTVKNNIGKPSRVNRPPEQPMGLLRGPLLGTRNPGR